VKLALAIIVALALALVVAARIPKSEQVLEDLPAIGWVVDLIGVSHDDLETPEELHYRADHPDALANLRLPHTEVRGDTLVVFAHDAFDAEQWRDRLAVHPAPLSAYSVVYVSDELTALRRSLGSDEQAKKLGIAVEYDSVGYHLQIAHGGMYVNADWAEAHHCDTRDRIVGTGVYCTVSPADRLAAYIKGDPGLFIDAHPLDIPKCRTFVPDNTATNERFYEVALPALTLVPTHVVAGAEALDLTVDLPAFPSDAELVVQLAGQLYPATLRPGGLSVACRGSMAFDFETAYALAAAGLHEIK
jgi:hypothetical protein